MQTALTRLAKSKGLRSFDGRRTLNKIAKNDGLLSAIAHTPTCALRGLASVSLKYSPVAHRLLAINRYRSMPQ